MNVLLINAILALLLSIIVFKKKSAPIVAFILGIWTFSFIAGVVYMSGLLMIEDIDVVPVLFLDVCLTALIIPIFSFDTKKINISESIIRKSELLLLIIGCLSILPFIEHSIYFVQTFLQEGYDDTIVDVYTNKMELGHGTVVVWLDPIALFLNTFLGRFTPITLFLLFLIFTKRSHIPNTKLLIYLVAVLRPVLNNINSSGRLSFTFFIISVMLLFLMFRNRFIIKIPKLYYIIGAYIVGVGTFAIITISFLRLGDSDVTMTLWTSLYFGEGTVNFANDAWQAKCNTLGDNSFSFFKTLIGLDTFTDILARREYWSISKTGVDPVRFYTFLGDWLLDMGKYMLFLLVVLLAYTVKFILKRSQYGIVSTFTFYIYCYIIATGFTFYCYKAYYGTLGVVECFIILLFLKYTSGYEVKNK